MKKIILIILALGFASVLFAQNTTAYDYLKRAPSVPEKACQLNDPQKDAFLKAVNNLSDLLGQDIKNCTSAATEYAENHQDELKKGIILNAGMSESDVQKMKNGKEMSDAEKQELANRMMQKNAGISMGEAKSLQNMSEAGQDAWAKDYAEEQKDKAKANPQKAKEMKNKNMSLFELLQEQTALREKITSRENKIRKIYEELDHDAEAKKLVLEKELEPFYKELRSINDGEGSTQADVEHSKRVKKQINSKQDAFCEEFTPRMIDFLVQCKESTEKALPDYDRSEEIQFEVTAAQTGTDKLSTGKGVYSLQSVALYLGYLSESLKYKMPKLE